MFPLSDHPRDCNDVYTQGGRLSGVYTIRPNNSAEFSVYCEFTAGNIALQRHLSKTTGVQSHP